MEIRFNEKTVVIIGGSTGIGASTVTSFLKSGAKVIFTGIENKDDIVLSDYSKTRPILAEYYQLDATQEDAVQKFANYVEEQYQGCDVLFNNAGVLYPNMLHKTPTKEWEKTINVNVNGVFLCSKYFIPQMLKKGGGAIINTSSMSGLQADYAFCAYNTSKGAVANLTRNMALDYAKYNIRVNAVAPGSVRTSMYNRFADIAGGSEVLDYGSNMVYPLNRIAEPEDISNAVLFLASDKASFITGINLVIDGGLTAWTGGPHDWEKARTLFNAEKDK